MTGLEHGNGEILACRAAHAAGIPFTMSTLSICSIEDVAAAVDKPFWFQLYVMKDRGFVRSLVERAAAAKCSALVLTVDLQVDLAARKGHRERRLQHAAVGNVGVLRPDQRRPDHVALPLDAMDLARQHRRRIKQ